MRQFFRMLLLALVLMTVALVSALTAMRLAIHGREVTIPKLVGMSPLEAERAGAASGLLVVVERQFYSADIPEGKIMTQMPPPGTKVRRGWSIRVAQSLGPQRVAIPGVTGGSERVADVDIRRRGLRSQRSEHDRDPNAGARTENRGWRCGEFRSALAALCWWRAGRPRPAGPFDIAQSL